MCMRDHISVSVIDSVLSVSSAETVARTILFYFLKNPSKSVTDPRVDL